MVQNWAMPKVRDKAPRFDALRYSDGKRKKVRSTYLQWREHQDPQLPERCDNPECQFHTSPPVWNGQRLPLILDHLYGVNTDNRPKNLRLLCPNCDSQNIVTRGGANAGRVDESAGGFAVKGPDGKKHYVLPAESGHYFITGTGMQAK